MKDVSICIVTHNNQEEIFDLLESLYFYTKELDFELFIVDNKSTDKTVSYICEKFPQINILRSNTNLGFGRAHNLVLNKINSRYHLILNPDIILKSNSIKNVYDFLASNPKVVAATPNILCKTGKIQNLPKKDPEIKYMMAGKLEKFSSFFSNLRKEYTMSSETASATKPFKIEFCTGCFMMIKTEILKMVNGFDERFFMYLEDADLSRRLRDYGDIMFLPNVNVIHAWHRESSKSLKFFLIHLQSMIKYLMKWKN